MNILTELWLGMPLGPYTATRGWGEPQIAASATELEQRGLIASRALTAAGRRFRDGIEERTDAMEERTSVENPLDALYQVEVLRQPTYERQRQGLHTDSPSLWSVANRVRAQISEDRLNGAFIADDVRVFRKILLGQLNPFLGSTCLRPANDAVQAVQQM